MPGFDRQYIFQDMRYARATEMRLKDIAATFIGPIRSMEIHSMIRAIAASAGDRVFGLKALPASLKKELVKF